MFRNRPVSLALVGLFMWVTGCTSYTQIYPGEVADHGTVRVTLTDGQREMISDARLAADSIKGRVKQEGQRVEWIEQAIPLDRVAVLEASSTSAGRTALVIAGGLLVVLGVANAIDCANTETWGC